MSARRIALAVLVVAIGVIVGLRARRQPVIAPAPMAADAGVTLPPARVAEAPPTPVVGMDAAPAAPDATAVEAYFPRDPDEWQGMRVEREPRQICRESAQCGMALACLDDQACGPCRVDADCARGEGCALDHCLPAARIACRGRADCADDELCVLSGISADPRGSAGMRAYCLAPTGSQEPEPEAPAEVRPAGAPPVSPTDLLDSLHEPDASAAPSR